jgi:hypothetical protein
MVFCTIEEAWGQTEIPEMKYYKEMPMPPVTPSNMYGYNQIEVVPRDKPIPHHTTFTADMASSDMNIRPVSQRIREEPSSISNTTLNEYKKLIEELKKENADLKRELKEKESQTASDGMLDVLLYISSGVFLLFFLEHVTSSARRF